MNDTNIFQRLEAMFTNVANQEHGSILYIFFAGIVFGTIIQYVRADKFEKIAGFAMLKDTIVPKMLFLTVGLTSIGLYFMIDAGVASYHLKPIILPGLIIGGLMFGVSMAIMGKCPGTGPISIAEGRVDVLVGAFGGLLGGLVFTLFYDEVFHPLMGESMGSIALPSLFPGYESFVVIAFGLAVIAVAILIPKKELEDEADICQITGKKLNKEEAKE
ncbi:MAG: hypothetical protein COA44_04930 [Arcobacter sp.]|nr:MAG: hypothetical protein COA44_04930 [Arcobacter sp.]